MDVAPQISFRDIDSSEFVEKRVREEIDKLERYFSRITSCRVVVEAPHRHHHKGKLYHLRIEIGVPGRPEIVVGHEGHDKHAHEDVYVAIRDAFKAARRQLEDYHRKIDNKVKNHRPQI